MRIITLLATLIAVLTFLNACGNQEPSSESGEINLRQERSSGQDEKQNGVDVTVDSEKWSTKNVTLAGSDVFALTADGMGTYGISVTLGYDLENTGPITNRCEYTVSRRDQDDITWADEECNIEIITLSAEKIEGNFSFTGINGEGAEKSITGRFTVHRSGMM